MSLQNLHNVFLSAQQECDSVIASSVHCVVSDSFKAIYSKKIKTAPSFSSYKNIEWLCGNAVVEFTTARTNKRIFFPTVGFFVAAKLVPLYEELLEYRSAVVEMLLANGTTIDVEEDNNGNVSQSAIQMVESYAGFTETEKGWIKKFLCETKNSQNQWWGKGKEIKRTNDFFVSPLMKCARLNAETQGEIADVAKQLAADPGLFSLLTDGPITTDTVGDMRSIALRAFAQHRSDESWSAGYYETNKGTRDYYAKLSASIEALDAAKVEEMFLGVKDAKGNVVFRPMWSGSNGTGWGPVKKGLEENPQATIDAIKKYCADASVVSAFTQKDFARPSGFGDSVVSELLMKFHPNAAIKCGTKTISVLKKLNLMSFKHEDSYDGWEYRQVLGIATGIKLRMDEMGITRTLEDHEEADYITVNEFIAWCNDNDDLIMQEWSKHMKHEIKLPNQKTVTENDFAAFIQKFIDAAKAAKLTYDDNLIKRFVCALLAKPFVVLTGLSGSGKTKLAQIFTQWIATQDMYRIVPVGADWTNSEKLLGYPNALDPNNYILPDTGVLKLMIDANDNPTVPFFLILDEMNLSHVERYFADFLSAMESEGSIKLYDGKNRTADDGTPVPPTIPFPKNLFVIGTMNVDETTHAFSPKVLDRAQVIEFRVNENQINAFLDNPTKPDLTQIDGKGVEYAAAFLNLHDNPIELSADDKTKMNDPLKKFFPVLAELSSEFAFRTASEALKFCGFARKSVMSEEETVDAAIMQKLLPKLHGSRRRLAASLEAFWGFCRKDGKTQSIADVCKKDATDKVEDVAKFPVSAEKIRRLYKAAEQNGFASYAEA